MEVKQLHFCIVIIITFFSPFHLFFTTHLVYKSLIYKRNLDKLETIQPNTSKTKKKLEIQQNVQNPTHNNMNIKYECYCYG